MKLRVY